MDLAGTHLEVDSVECAYAGEVLADPGHHEQGWFRHEALLIHHYVRPYVAAKMWSLMSRVAPMTPAVSSSSDSTIGRFPVASGAERR